MFTYELTFLEGLPPRRPAQALQGSLSLHSLLVTMVFLWNVSSSKWGKKCQDGSKEWLRTSWAFQLVEGRHVVSDWSMIVRNGEGLGAGHMDDSIT